MIGCTSTLFVCNLLSVISLKSPIPVTEKFWCGKQGSHCSTNSNSALPKVQFLCLLVVPTDSLMWNSACLFFLISANSSLGNSILHREHIQWTCSWQCKFVMGNYVPPFLVSPILSLKSRHQSLSESLLLFQTHKKGCGLLLVHQICICFPWIQWQRPWTLSFSYRCSHNDSFVIHLRGNFSSKFFRSAGFA